MYDLIQQSSASFGRRVPYHGLTYQDYSTILTQFGCHPHIIQTKDDPSGTALDTAAFRNLCVYVESGFPVLTSYYGHVVAAIGHTLDYHKGVTANKDGLIDSTDFFKQLIVVDDNAFPYQLLGRATDPENYGSAYTPKYSLESIYLAVCPLPEKVFLTVDSARQQCHEVISEIRKNNPKLALAISASSNDQWVTRLFITSSSSYKRRRLEKAVVDSNLVDPVAIQIAHMHLPHFLWVMEVSPRSHYTSGFCTAEIVLDATAGDSESGMLFTRIGRKLLLHQCDFGIGSDMDASLRFSQYSHNLGEL